PPQATATGAARASRRGSAIRGGATGRAATAPACRLSAAACRRPASAGGADGLAPTAAGTEERANRTESSARRGAPTEGRTTAEGGAAGTAGAAGASRRAGEKVTWSARGYVRITLVACKYCGVRRAPFAPGPTIVDLPSFRAIMSGFA